MRCGLSLILLPFSIVMFQANTRAQDVLVPAGTLLHCTLDEPNLSSATASNRESRLVFDASVVVADRDTDLALLKIDANCLPTLELSDSNNLKQGQLVPAFGSPLDLDNSVSMEGCPLGRQTIGPGQPDDLCANRWGH